MVGPPSFASGVWGSLSTGGEPRAPGPAAPQQPSQGVARSQLGGSGELPPWTSASTPVKRTFSGLLP